MKILIFISVYVLILFFTTGKNESFQQKEESERVCIDATNAQEVLDVHSKVLSSRKQIEFWDERSYIELKIYR